MLYEHFLRYGGGPRCQDILLYHLFLLSRLYIFFIFSGRFTGNCPVTDF